MEETQQRIQVAQECVRRIVELDTENAVGELNIMESTNNVALLKFRDVAHYTGELHKNSSLVLEQEALCDRRGVAALQQAERRVAQLERVAHELDEWSRELLLKIKVERGLGRGN